MILSKANLLVHKAASHASGSRRALQGVKVEQDGTTAAANGDIIVAVEPANAEDVLLPIGDLATRLVLGEVGILLPAEMLEKTIKTLPKDKRFSLQHVALTRTADPGKVGLVSLDQAGNTALVEGVPLLVDFPDWRKQFKLSGEKDIHRVCINRKALIELLSLIDSIAVGTPNVFLEIDEYDNKIVARAVNGQTKQRVVGVCATLVMLGQWLPRDDWEEGVFSESELGDEPEPETTPIRRVVVKKKEAPE